MMKEQTIYRQENYIPQPEHTFNAKGMDCGIRGLSMF